MPVKIIKFLLTLFLLFLARPVLAADEVNLHFFWASGCPHCAEEKIFLDELKNRYPQLIIKDYEITSRRENLELLQKIGAELQVDVSGIPFTVIGQQQFIGYLSDETTGKEIEEAVKCAFENGCEDIVSGLFVKGARQTEKESKIIPETFLKVPILGELRAESLSLPVLTLVVALLDGFNPCAMWTLLFLISLLLGIKNRKRMWALGITFIATSSFVYFLFLSAWLNLFLFLGFVVWVRILIGFVALIAGGHYLKDYFFNKTGGCEVMGDEKRQKTFKKIQKIVQERQFFLAIGGIILLAIAVNLVELICSAGLPAVYTKILSLSNLPVWRYYLYFLFYILIFMLDDLFVFFTAMITLQAVGIQSKYSRFSHLIGGILMFIVGVLLLFKPEWLMFG